MALLSKFPLLNLPGKAIRETIRTMNIDEIVCLSLVSKRCKQHVISVDMKATSFEVSILEVVNFDIETSTTVFYLEFPSDEAVMAGQKRKLKTPHCFSFCLYEDDENIIDLGRWKWTKFDYQDWLEHLRAVFHYQGIDKLNFINGSFGYVLDDIKKVFGKAKDLFVEHTGCYDFNQLVLHKFSYIEKIRFNIDIFQNLKFSPTILIQNISQLCILNFHGTPQTIKLNDLLLINSKSIKINDLQFSPKDINKFIKLWIKGSNPKLECLRSAYPTNGILNTNEIMKGIKYEEVSEDHKRWFKCCHKKIIVYGGMDIKRQDGTRATIEIYRTDDWFSFNMFVWHDHCLFFLEDLYAAQRAKEAKQRAVQEEIARLTELLNEAMRAQ